MKVKARYWAKTLFLNEDRDVVIELQRVMVTPESWIGDSLFPLHTRSVVTMGHPSIPRIGEILEFELEWTNK